MCQLELTMKEPLNGTKTHALSETALLTLARLLGGPITRSTINPGVANRLERENLVEVVELPSPYRTVNGKIRHLRVTDAGRQRLAETRATGQQR